MCFSAGGSFAASGVLTLAGAACLHYAPKRERMLAAVPLIFAIQQAIEGFQWLAPHPSVCSSALGYGFLIFAFFFWPAFVSIATYRVEQRPMRRRVLLWFAGIGALISCALLWILLSQPLNIQLHPFGIRYVIFSPLGYIGGAMYLIATCGSLLVSSRRSFQWLGIVGAASALLTELVFQSSFISVWCFFSALLSLYILVLVSRKRPANESRK
jgi:hypothetical protein